jgi:hypothetical protein
MQHQPRQPASLPRQGAAKPVLPMTQLPIYRVKQRHLEAYLVKVYRMDGFDFLAASGATPGICPEYQVSTVLPPAWTAKEAAERIRQGHRSKNLALILNVLCVDGYIPPGRYIIDTHPEPPPAPVYRDLLMKTADPDHPACVAFRKEHGHNRNFMQLAVRMDQAVRAQKEAAE